MKKIILLLFTTFTIYSQNTDIELINQRWRADLIKTNLTDSGITTQLNNLGTDGSWSDIDYADVARSNWKPIAHVDRLRSICMAYNKTTSIHYHSVAVKNKIKLAIDFWIQRKPTSVNWYSNQIAVPIRYADILLLMKTGDTFGLSQNELETYANTLLTYYNQITDPLLLTGQNQIWFLKISIAKACIFNNHGELVFDFNLAYSELRIHNGTEEGIKSDYSFHQHGSQLYQFGYGKSYIVDVSYFAKLSNQTVYDLSVDKMKILVDLILEGHQWFTHKDVCDFNTIGRTISYVNAVTISSIKTTITDLTLLTNYRKTELTNYIALLNKGSFQSPGNKYFHKSDIMVQHGANHYLSAKVPSLRTVGSEVVNSENIKLRYFPWGVTNIMVSGQEYIDVFPVWDWTRIPGCTIELGASTALQPGNKKISTVNFGGGVSDGTHGLVAYNYSDPTYSGVTFKKSYFFTPKALYCMGIDINASKTNPIITSVNQCNSNGEVIINSNNTQSTLSVNEKNYSNLKWVYHDKVGYIFPENSTITVANKDQSGAWYDINLSASKDIITKKVFSTWFSHGTTPNNAGYEYIVVPNQATVSDFKNWNNSNQLTKISNTNKIQAFYDANASLYGITFYETGTLQLETNLSVSVNQACTLLIKKRTDGYTVSVADPTQLLSTIQVTISKRLVGTNTTINANNTSTINAILPSGDEAGKTLSFVLTNETLLNTPSDREIFNSLVQIYSSNNSMSITLNSIESSDFQNISVYDLNGKKVYSNSNFTTPTFKIENLSTGVYIVSILNKNNLLSQKVIVK
jgi:chondroitin AC lyase